MKTIRRKTWAALVLSLAVCEFTICRADAQDTIAQPQNATLERTIAAAQAGDVAAQVELGRKYTDGVEVARDYGVALHWFLKASEKENPMSEMAIGLAYREGHGLSVNLAESAWWYQKAAEHGSPTAQAFLAQLYQRGEGVARSDAQAVKLYQAAATNGYIPAQIWLGYLYETGTAVTRDYAQALKWYRAAADHGSAEAQYYVGRLYAQGSGVPQSREEAERWFNRAAEQGFTKARTELASSQPNQEHDQKAGGGFPAIAAMTVSTVAIGGDVPPDTKPSDPTTAPAPATVPSSIAPAATPVITVPVPTLPAAGATTAVVDPPGEDLRELIGVKPGLKRVDVLRVPAMSLRGFVQPHKMPPVALLEITELKRVFLVQVGTEIPYTVSGRVYPLGRNELTGLGDSSKSAPAPARPGEEREQSQVILKVVKVSSEGVTVETGLMSQTIVVR